MITRTARTLPLPGREVLGWGVFLVLLAFFPALTSVPYFIRTGITALMFVTLALAFDLVLGRVGALSLAQPVFFGFGAYAAALLSVRFGTSFWQEIGVAWLGAAALAVFIGIPAFRLSLHSFAIGTLGFQVSAQLVAQNWMSVTSGPMCVTAIPPVSLSWPGGSTQVISLTAQYELILLIAAIAIATTLLVTRVRLGLAFAAVRDDPLLASARGLWPNQVRLTAFILSAMLSATAGAFVAHFQTVICPDSLDISYTVALLIMVFIGGVASLRGVVSGALLFTVLPQFLRVVDQWRLVIYGALLLVIVITLPGGLEEFYRILERFVGRKLGLGRGPAGSLEGEGSSAATVPQRVVTDSSEKREARMQVPDRVSSTSHNDGKSQEHRDRGGQGISQDGPRGQLIQSFDKRRLEVRSLTKLYQGVHALQDLSFVVEPGELVGLIGPNGSGKTTAIDCVSGVQAADGGAVLFGDRSILGTPTYNLAKHGLARTFQTVRVFPMLTVEQNLLVAGLGRASHWDEWRQYLRRQDRWPVLHERSRELIALFGLQRVADTPAGHLSYGQRKLVEFAAALVIPPRVLLLDEPVAAVNPTTANVIREWILRLHSDGVSILLVEHNMEFVLGVCERLIVLDHGLKIAEGEPTAVMKDPGVQEAYFGR